MDDTFFQHTVKDFRSLSGVYCIGDVSRLKDIAILLSKLQANQSENIIVRERDSDLLKDENVEVAVKRRYDL